MSVIALTTGGNEPSVVTDREDFSRDGQAVLIVDADMSQLDPASTDCNISYDLRVGDLYRDHRFEESRSIGDDDEIEILPGMAVIIRTLEEVTFPKWRFGYIVPKIGLLQRGLANTPTKIDPGYLGRLLITTFNHGRNPLSLRKGERFCAMFVSNVEGAIKPYNKQGKDLIGRTSKNLIRRFFDRIEAQPVTISAVTAFITALVVSVISWFK
jgi:dCTP deaminase